MTSDPSIPLIVAILALFGVTITALGNARNERKKLKASHSLKISEMRQDWINNLRDAMAEFQSFGVTPGLAHQSERDWYKAGTKIELLMNPADPDYAELQKCMYAFLSTIEAHDKYRANPEFVSVCQRILKREWEVTKEEIRSLDEAIVPTRSGVWDDEVTRHF